ncbi:Gamma-glutamyl phosphate reductase [Frankliniella fusca]|uniref:Gamma-glutamyl phosphate reductase n=1 Tax=Frankliniella fusca TaxID=407009 RepID=A0AAE1HG33_9NEOP|nr:Gamma-glutamyl phosphate reductase [Frankliniella fusca]
MLPKKANPLLDFVVTACLSCLICPRMLFIVVFQAVTVSPDPNTVLRIVFVTKSIFRLIRSNGISGSGWHVSKFSPGYHPLPAPGTTTAVSLELLADTRVKQKMEKTVLCYCMIHCTERLIVEVDYCESDKLWCHESFGQYLALVSLYLGLLAEDFGCLLHQ